MRVRVCGFRDVPASKAILYTRVSNGKIELNICVGTAYF